MTDGRDQTRRRLSPLSGWIRDDWVELADAMLRQRMGSSSPGRALIHFDGPTGGYGHSIDGLEGFARTFLLAAFRIAGDPTGTRELANWYADGLTTGTDPDSPERWVRPDEVDQAKVEAAAIAVGLHLTRGTIWNVLDDVTRSRVISYLATAVGQPYPRINWVWFRIVTEQFLASVDGPYRSQDIEDDLAVADTFFRDDGWLSDGDSRAYDHYTGWALHLYPVIWADMVSDQPSHAPRVLRYRRALAAYLDDALCLIGGDGSPLIQGRSLVYRFAAAAPFWAGAAAGVDSIHPGLLRRAATAIVRHFDDRGAAGRNAPLTLGWHREWHPLAQHYSGPGSPYWAAKGMFGISLPADHPVWTAVEQPLPIEVGDTTRVLVAPGWLLSATRNDGIVRIINHGTDHALPGEQRVFGHLYARMTYSTATASLHTGRTTHVDGSVSLIDAAGRRSERGGFDRGPMATIPVDDGSICGWGVSTMTATWADPAEVPDHGYGRAAAEARVGAKVITASLVRGAWEVRLVRVIGAHDGVLEITGWPTPVLPDAPVSELVPLIGFISSGEHHDWDCTPLSRMTRTPWIATDRSPDGRWRAAAIRLGGVSASASAPQVSVQDNGTAHVRWPDGGQTIAVLPADRGAHDYAGSPTPSSAPAVPAKSSAESSAPYNEV